MSAADLLTYVALCALAFAICWAIYKGMEFHDEDEGRK